MPTSRKHDIRLTLTGLGLFALLAGTLLAVFVGSIFFLDLTWDTAWLAPLIIVFECWLFTGLFIVAHDAMHGTLAPRWPKVNNAIGAAIIFLYAGFDWRTFKTAHMAHHKAPGTADDPDFNADNPRDFMAWYVRFFMTYFGWRSLLIITAFVALLVFVLGAPILNVILFHGAASILSSFQLFYFGTYLPHRHGEPGFADRHNARSNDFSNVVSLLTCYHFGYHHEHHLAPHVPWWLLPNERRARRLEKRAS